MDKFTKELIEGIEEISSSTGITTKECIVQAIDMLEQEKKERRKNYMEMTEKQMFKNW